MTLAAALRRHPFAVRAHFDRSLVLTYSLPVGEAKAHLPDALVPDTYTDSAGREYAFLAAALVQTRDLRPAPLPALLGRSFLLVGYRLFVRYTDVRGRRLRGLYVLGSDTDSALMTRLGGLLTYYRYRHIDLSLAHHADRLDVSSQIAGLNIAIDLHAKATLPVGSPFPDWRVARRFAGPLPFTFSVDEDAGEVIIVEGVRTNWTPAPVEVLTAQVEFWRELNLGEPPRLASAFQVTDIPYRWKRGRTERWPHRRARGRPCAEWPTWCASTGPSTRARVRGWCSGPRAPSCYTAAAHPPPLGSPRP